VLISRASFGLITQLLDASAPFGEERLSSSLLPHPSSLSDERRALEGAAALGVGSLAEEVALGDDTTVPRFLQLQHAAAAHGLETFLRLRDLTDEALEVLRQGAAEAAARRAPGEIDPPGVRLVVDLGQPDKADLERWLQRPRGEDPQHPEGFGPGGHWSQALAFSVFAPDGETAMRRVERIARPLLQASQRPGIEQPVWLAGLGVGEAGATSDPGGVIQAAAHALALGIERIFLADGPAGGWWPDHLHTPPDPLRAFHTLAQRLDGATDILHLAPGQYRIGFPGRPDRCLLWKHPDTATLPAGLHGLLEITTPIGETRHVEAARLKLTAEPIFVDGAA
jgi:hypothetical protein